MRTSILMGLFLLTSCCISTGPTVPPAPGEETFFAPSYPSGYPQGSCALYSYSDNNSSFELDLASDVAAKEETKLQQTQQYYMNQFNLSVDAATKMARAVIDFNRLQQRSYEDMLDFAVRLYGVNPKDLTHAIALGQMGENAELENLLEKAAMELETTSENMREIIKTLHSEALFEAGIRL